MNHISPNDWIEDFADENGNYTNECAVCTKLFRGYKRRKICKVCADERFPDIELTRLELRNNTLEIAAKHPVATKIIEAMAEMLDDLGGENYVSMAGVSQKTGKQYEIIVKHLNGEKAKKLQATVDEQAKELERLGAIVSELESVKRESKGVAGYHLNGDIATWEEVGL